MSEQPKKTAEDIQEIINNIHCMDRRIRLLPKQDGYLLQVIYDEADVDHPEDPTPIEQHARKWYVSSFSTETEIVETAFKALRTSMEHVLKEHFTYKGRRVYSPHFSIDARIRLCDEKAFDARD